MSVQPEGAEWHFTGRDELEALLEEHDLGKDDICLVGSISLSARGLREHDDLDICIRPEKRKTVDTGAFDGFVKVTVERYENIDLSDEELVTDDQYYDVIDGFKVVRPEIAFSYKKLRDLPKDERDVELLENYSQSTDDWNWDLYRSDYGERPSSLLSRGIQSLRSDGLLITLDKVAGLLTRKFPVIRRVLRALPVFDVRTPYHALRGQTRTLTTAELLNRQRAAEEFVSLDVVAYWVGLQALDHGDDLPFEATALDADVAALSKLDPAELEPLALSQRHRVLRPDHFARLLHADVESVEVSFSFARTSPADEAWCRDRGFTDEDLSLLREQKAELLEETGALFHAIFWPPAHEYFDEMEAELSDHLRVVETTDYEVDDIEAFVHAVYDAQEAPAPDWAIDWKADMMTSFPSTIRVAHIELPNPRLRDGVSREIEMVKNDVRHAFMDEFSDKHYLSLIHATDNFDDNRKAKAVIESHT